MKTAVLAGTSRKPLFCKHGAAFAQVFQQSYPQILCIACPAALQRGPSRRFALKTGAQKGSGKGPEKRPCRMVSGDWLLSKPEQNQAAQRLAQTGLGAPQRMGSARKRSSRIWFRVPFCAPHPRTNAEPASRAGVSVPKRHRQNTTPKRPRQNAASGGQIWRRLLRCSLFFWEQIKGPQNASIARFFGLGCYQSRSEIRRWLRCAGRCGRWPIAYRRVCRPLSFSKAEAIAVLGACGARPPGLLPRGGGA